MRDRIKRKLQSSKAFTLAEMLLAVLILAMVSVIVATGIPVARNAYEKIVLSSNAEVLLSTTVSMLRNELGTAQDVVVPTEEPMTTITYYNLTRGASSKILLSNDDKKEIMFQRYITADYPVVPLISSKTATADLYVTYDSVDYENGILKFTGLSVNRVSGTANLASRDTLSIRVISE